MQPHATPEKEMLHIASTATADGIATTVERSAFSSSWSGMSTDQSASAWIRDFCADLAFALGCLVLLTAISGLIAISLVTLFLVAVILRLLNLVLSRQQQSLTLNQTACKKFEDVWLKSSNNSFPPSTSSDWLYLHHGISAHHIRVPCDQGLCPNNSTSCNNMVLIHGTGSSAALAWASVAGQLAKSYNLYAPDLPGFGRSTVSWEQVATASCEDLENMYADFIANYIDAMGLVKPIVVAHSIGGFFAIKFIRKYPDYASKLVLVSSAGILPTPLGFYFAWLFKVGFPIRQIRSLGRFASFILYSMFDFRSCSCKAYYWLQLNGSPCAFGDHVVSRFLTLSRMGLRLHWNRPALHDLLTIGVPLAFIYGESDNLFPPSQGRLVQRLMRAHGVVGIVPGAWHSPFHVNQGGDFLTQLMQMIDNVQVPNASLRLLSSIETLDPATFRASWNVTTTKIQIHTLYAELRALCIESPPEHTSPSTNFTEASHLDFDRDCQAEKV